MNFTREPIVETIITPKEGFKLVLRNSKGGGQEEFFVDAVEVITFGKNCFYRSLEKPKSFLVPVADYEIVEVRETRMLLKTPGSGEKKAADSELPQEPKKRERRRSKKKRSKSEESAAEETPKDKPPQNPQEEPAPKEAPKPVPLERKSLIPPPSGLISESISRLKESEPPLLTEEQPEDED